MAKSMRGLSNHTETNISETSDHDVDLNFENLGVWNQKLNLIERRKQIIHNRRYVDQNKYKSTFHQSELKKYYKVITKEAETYKPISLGKWESDLSAIMPEPCIDFLGSGEEEQANPMAIANSYRGQESISLNQVQNHQLVSSNINERTIDVADQQKRLKSAGVKSYDNRPLSLISMDNELRQVSKQKNISQIRNVFTSGEMQITNINQLSLKNRATKHFARQYLKAQGCTRDLNDSECTVLTHVKDAFELGLKKNEAIKEKFPEFFMTEVEHEKQNKKEQQMAIEQERSETVAKLNMLENYLTHTKKEILSLCDDSQEIQKNFEMFQNQASLEETARRDSQAFPGKRSLIQQRIDRMSLRAELPNESLLDCNKIHVQKLKEQKQHNKLLKLAGIGNQTQGQPEGEKAKSSYRKHQVFSQQALDTVPGLQDYCRQGNSIKTQSKNVKQALLLAPEQRTKHDLNLIKVYFQKNLDEFKQIYEDRFFQQLSLVCTAIIDIPKDTKIPADPQALRIVYEGKALDNMHAALPRNTILQYQGEIFNYVCEHQECTCKNSLVIFEIDKDAYHELLNSYKASVQYDLTVFLSFIDFAEKLTNQQINQLAQLAKVQRYSKDQLIFEEKDFPLTKFFIVKKGLVNLKKSIVVKQSNFMPTGVTDYERRVKQRSEAYCFGKVKVYQYFGLLESLSNLKSSQMPCKFGTAEDDGTEVVWFTKLELIRILKEKQIKDLLDLLQSKPTLVQSVPDQELIVRSMVSQKLKELNQPRHEIFLRNQPTPKRIMHLVDENEKRAKGNRFDVRTMSPNSVVTQVLNTPKRRLVLEKDEVEKYDKMTRGDFSAKQKLVQDQKLDVAGRTIEMLFHEKQWNPF